MLDQIFIKKLNVDLSKVDLDKSFTTYDANTNYNIINLYLVKDENVICDCCGKVMKIRGSKTSEIKTSTPDIDKVRVIVHRRVYACENKHTTLQENPLTGEGRRISFFKDLRILEALRDKNSTYSAVAERFNVSTSYVIKVFDTRVAIKRLKLPQVLCFDEVYGKRLGQNKYCFVMYSPQWKKVIDILDNRFKEDLLNYFNRIPMTEREEVKFISIDRWDTYREVAKACFPKSKICVDSFHVIKHLNECFDRIRKRIMRKYAHLKDSGDFNYWLLKKYAWMLKSNPKEGDESRLYSFKKASFGEMHMYRNQIIDLMLKLDDTFKRAYYLKEEYRDFNKTADIDNANYKLEEVIISFKNEDIYEYREFVRMLENWKDEIINSFNRVNGFRISNGPMERINSDIKTIFRLSFGSTNFERVRNRILFALNEDSPILSVAKTTTNKKKGKSRGKYKKKNKKNENN